MENPSGPGSSYLPVLADAENRVLVVAELHAVDLSVVSSPAHRALVALHIYGRDGRTVQSDRKTSLRTVIE